MKTSLSGFDVTTAVVVWHCGTSTRRCSHMQTSNPERDVFTTTMTLCALPNALLILLNTKPGVRLSIRVVMVTLLHSMSIFSYGQKYCIIHVIA